jgi:hypothetical protein
MVLKNLTPEGGKVLKKSSGKGPYVLRTDTESVLPSDTWLQLSGGAVANQGHYRPTYLTTDFAVTRRGSRPPAALYGRQPRLSFGIPFDMKHAF